MQDSAQQPTNEPAPADNSGLDSGQVVQPSASPSEPVGGTAASWPSTAMPNQSETPAPVDFTPPPTESVAPSPAFSPTSAGQSAPNIAEPAFTPPVPESNTPSLPNLNVTPPSATDTNTVTPPSLPSSEPTEPPAQ